MDLPSYDEVADPKNEGKWFIWYELDGDAHRFYLNDRPEIKKKRIPTWAWVLFIGCSIVLILGVLGIKEVHLLSVFISYITGALNYWLLSRD